MSTFQLVALDTDSLGDAFSKELFEDFGAVAQYQQTMPEETAERIAQANVIITNKVELNRELLTGAKDLKLVCISATGMNNIDLEAAEELGIVVKNAAGYSTESVAQWTMGMMLTLNNSHRYYHDYCTQGHYQASHLFTHHGRTYKLLKGKQLGIIGLGAIGSEVARLAEAFGMDITYHSSSGRNTDQPYSHQSLEELLSSSDFVSINAPLNKWTENLIGYEELALMKPTAYLLNAGRGGIVVEADLVRALNEDLLAGAGIDVFAEEPPKSAFAFTEIEKQEKLLLSPHVAWAAREARDELLQIVRENIRSFIDKEK